MRNIGILSVAFAGAFVAPAAWAQSAGPSASQIIQALKPTSHLSATTRGIVPLQPGSTTPSPKLHGTASSPAAMRVSGARSAAPSINLNIDFALGSAQLTPQAITELDRLGHALTDSTLASYKFKLVGHTDTTGAPATNMALSDARAKAVDQYLQSKFNIAPTRLAATGVGEQDLLVPTGPNTPERANRRVQVINLGK
ncbi:MAG: OmpA family protein [Proteobacteria bacterium]|nr:OmpA family protein [Pseudomonadota bacterium]